MEYVTDKLVEFSTNLRLLCNREGSISQVCRKIGVNRQQFNKYLSGLHLPSPRNLRLIANYFGVSTQVLFSNPEEFSMLLEGNVFHAIENLRNRPEVKNFIETLLIASKVDGGEYLGVYDRYQYSSIYKGKILRSAFCIYQNGDFLQHYYIERFPSYDAPRTIDYVFKYHGFVLPLADRIFTIDFESIQRNEMTFGAFASVQRNAKKFMFGVGSGIAATMFRQPYSTKIALHYRAPGLINRDQLGHLTTLDRTDPSIPKEALQFLGDGSDMIQIA